MFSPIDGCKYGSILAFGRISIGMDSKENGYSVPLSVHYYNDVVFATDAQQTIHGYAPYVELQEALTDSSGQFVTRPSYAYSIHGYTNYYGCFNPEPATFGTPSTSPKMRPIVVPYIIKD